MRKLCSIDLILHAQLLNTKFTYVIISYFSTLESNLGLDVAPMVFRCEVPVMQCDTEAVVLLSAMANVKHLYKVLFIYCMD